MTRFAPLLLPWWLIGCETRPRWADVDPPMLESIAGSLATSPSEAPRDAPAREREEPFPNTGTPPAGTIRAFPPPQGPIEYPDEEGFPDESKKLRADLDDGLTFTDPQAGVRLHLGGSADFGYWHYDERNVRDRELRVDRAVLRFEGSLLDDAATFRIAPDLKGIDSRYGLEEAWGALTFDPALRVSAGLIPIASGIEDTMPREELSFVDHSFPHYIGGRTDLGVRLDGTLANTLTYDLVAALGEGFDPLGQDREGRQLSARFVLHPFARERDADEERGLLEGVFGTFGYSEVWDWEGPLDVATELRNKVFRTRNLEADGARFVHLGFGADVGPVRFAVENVRGSLIDLDLPGGSEQSFRSQITALQTTLSWMITGESYRTRFRRSDLERYTIQPDSPLFGEGATGPGAFEIAIRYVNADIDRALFDTNVATFAQSSQEFRTFTAALNWYWNRSTRLGFEVVRVIADQRPVVFDSHGRDTSFVLYLRVTF